MRKVAVGIDIGSKWTKIGFVDADGETFGQHSIQTDDDQSFEAYLSQLHDAVQTRKGDLEADVELIGIGMGAPNANYRKGTIEYPTYLKWKGVTPVVDKLKKLFDLPIYLHNDANAAAIGEMVFGAAKGMQDFVLLSLGSGLGSGIVANGEVVYGHDGFAGELGHLVVFPGGRKCGCGRKGCLEMYVSDDGLCTTVTELLKEHAGESTLEALSDEELTVDAITNAAIRRDPVAAMAFDQTAKILGAKLADTIALFSPEAIFLHGRQVSVGDYLLKPIREYLEENVMYVYRKNPTRILPSGLLSKDLAVLGSASIVWREVGKGKL